MPGRWVIGRVRLIIVTWWRTLRWSLDRLTSLLCTRWVKLGTLFWWRDMSWLSYTGEREMVSLFCPVTKLGEERIRWRYHRR